MLRDKATEGKRERKTKVGETERKKNVRQCGLWDIERESYRYKDREGAGKIDTMEERERDKSGRENKIERETGSVMSEKERYRVGRKIQKNTRKRDGEISKERQGWDNKER